MSWACWLKRVFDIDIESCPRCGGRLRIIAPIVDPQVMVKILTHLSLPARAPTPNTGVNAGNLSVVEAQGRLWTFCDTGPGMLAVVVAPY